jgi:ABC-type dipeptide/oligopeptide/nickel transport system permease subunit
MIKGKKERKSMMYSGVITLIIGGIAAIVAFMIGHGLNFLVS